MARRWSSLVPVIALLAVSGCQRDAIRAYTAPKDAKSSPPPAAVQNGPATTSAIPEWDVPEGWQQIPGTGMRFATLILDGDNAPEIRITPLGAMAGESLSNVNRWRTQIGLDPIEESELGSVLTTIDVDGYSTDLIRLVSDDGAAEPQETLAAILRAEAQVWFFMTSGPRETIEPHEDAFRDFVAGIRMKRPGGAPTNMASPAGSGDSGAAPSALAWVLPAGWTEVPSTSSMRLATFRVGQGDEAAEVAITKFPGQVGGLLANVNRWRGQLGLAPVDDLANQAQESVNVAGSPAMLLDLAPDGAAAGDSRMLVVLAPRGEFTWFLKMTGTHSTLGQEKAGFESFVQSVVLPEGS